MTKSRKQRANKGRAATRDGEVIPRPFGAQRAQDRVVVPQKLFICLQRVDVISAATGNTLAVEAVSSNVVNATEWGVMAGVWGEYRVISMTADILLYYNVADAKDLLAGGTGGFPGPFVSCEFGSQTISGGWLNIIDNSGFKFHPTGRSFTMKASAQSQNPFALEWSSTAAAPPAAQVFGCVADTEIQAPAGFNAVPMLAVIQRFDVEFRGRR